MQAIIGREFPDVVIPLINNAKSSIKIVVFDWRWYANDFSNPVQLFNQSLVRAVGRGVGVFAIGNNSDVVATLKACGVQARKINSKNLLHAKLIIIDGKIIVCGSHNITSPAFSTNHEISMVHEDEESALRFIDFFQSLWSL